MYRVAALLGVHGVKATPPTRATIPLHRCIAARHCLACLFMRCQNPHDSQAQTRQNKAACLAYICGAAYALLCFAWNISINIIFIIDSIVANGYVGIITSNEQRINPWKTFNTTSRLQQRT